MSKQISREDILRMIGLRDSAGLMSKVNSLMIDMYDEGGKLAEYSTQIIQTSKNITLLAQRVTDNENYISDLTVKYDKISLTVKNTKETVDEHTESITQLTLKENEINQRVTVIEGDYVTSADLTLYVDKNMVSWLTGSANNVVFNFTNKFQIQSKGTAVATLDSNGNLTILGALIQNSSAEALNITGNSSMSYTNAGSTVDGIRCTSSGVQRWSTIYNSWIPLYSQRFARTLVYTSTSSKTLYNDDDYVLSFGQYEKTIVMPPSPSDGKIITIANISAVSFIKPNTGQTLNVGGAIVRPTDQGKDLNDYDLAELVYYNSVWYWHYMEV